MERTRATTRWAMTGVCGLFVLAAAACGDGTTPEPPEPPTIDGIRSPGEWDGATVFQPTTDVGPGVGPSTILITTDGTNLYIALEVTDPATSEDRFVVRFDNDNNDLLTDGDDIIALTASGDVSDGQYSSSRGSYTSDDGSEDVEGAAGQNGATAFFELSHPLNTGDPDDIALGVGDTVGMCFRYFNDGAGNSGVPGSCALAVNQQATYLDVTIRRP